MEEQFKLRKLQARDAPLMLEWMHDEDVVRNLQNNFAEMTLVDCLGFIESAGVNSHNLHLAIVDLTDAYLGTVSLKNITKRNAEFAITIRKAAMGTGCSVFAMREVIKKGFQELGLQEIYWCVSNVNNRAIRFYDKNGYERVALGKIAVDKDMIKACYSDEQLEKYIWYHVIR